MEEIVLAHKFAGLEFIVDNTLVVSLVMWEHIKLKISEGGSFHRQWGKGKKETHEPTLDFIATFIIWKINNDPEWQYNRLQCIDRYAIITDRIKL